MGEYHANPVRGCGTKKKGGYYLESETSREGELRLWTWILGSGTADGENCFLSIPPRQMTVGNLPASLLLGEYISPEASIWDGVHLAGELTANMKVYNDLKGRCGELSLMDHVGSSFYSPWSFAFEVMKYGPSRRVPPAIAKIVACKLPVPIVFAHSDMPLFEHLESRDNALTAAKATASSFNWGDVQFKPTWMDDGWGLFVKHKNYGNLHYMSLLLEAMSLSGEVENEAGMVQLQEIVAEQNCYEQPFGASWVTKVTYCLQDDDDLAVVGLEMGSRGIDVLDLDNVEGGD